MWNPLADLVLVSRKAVERMALRLALVVRFGCRVPLRLAAMSLRRASSSGPISYLGECLPGARLGLYTALLDSELLILESSDTRMGGIPGERAQWPCRQGVACRRSVAAPGRTLSWYLITACSARHGPLAGRRQSGPLTSEDAWVSQDHQGMLRFIQRVCTIRRSRAPSGQVVLSSSC